MRILKKSLLVLLTVSLLAPKNLAAYTGVCVANCDNPSDSSSGSSVGSYSDSGSSSYAANTELSQKEERLAVAEREIQERAAKNITDYANNQRRMDEYKAADAEYQRQVAVIKQEAFHKTKSELMMSLKMNAPPVPEMRPKKHESKINEPIQKAPDSFLKKIYTQVKDWIQTMRLKVRNWFKENSLSEMIRQIPVARGLKDAWDSAQKFYENLSHSVKNLFGVSSKGMNEGINHLADPNDRGEYETEYNERIEGTGKKAIESAEELSKDTFKDNI